MAKAQTLVVVGQGYVGLPVAMRGVEVGFDVIGVDLDADRIASLRAGRSFVGDVTDSVLAAALATRRYRAETDYAASHGFDFAVITVPTPLREGVPDLSFIESAAASLAERIRVGATIVLESTTYPGTTEELVVPILENGSGLQAGRDFFVGYSPERIDPGNEVWGFVETPKVVSGIDAASLERVRSLYDRLVNITVPVSSPREAELTKLLENTFRHVNIALVNELAVFANTLGVDIWEAIDAAATKPFGFMKFTPGPGVGGHCLPVDPTYLAWDVRRRIGQTFRFVELANDVNDHMPDYVVQRLIRLLNNEGKALRGSRIAMIGLAYKRNSGDIRESPSLRLIELLEEYGADLVGVDEFVEAHRWPAGVARARSIDGAISGADAALLVTDHDGIDYERLADLQVPVLDTKNRLRGRTVETL